MGWTEEAPAVNGRIEEVPTVIRRIEEVLAVGWKQKFKVAEKMGMKQKEG